MVLQLIGRRLLLLVPTLLLGLVLLHVGGVMLQQVRQGGVLRRMVPFLK